MIMVLFLACSINMLNAIRNVKGSAKATVNIEALGFIKAHMQFDKAEDSNEAKVTDEPKKLDKKVNEQVDSYIEPAR